MYEKQSRKRRTTTEKQKQHHRLECSWRKKKFQKRSKAKGPFENTSSHPNEHSETYTNEEYVKKNGQTISHTYTFIDIVTALDTDTGWLADWLTDCYTKQNQKTQSVVSGWMNLLWPFLFAFFTQPLQRLRQQHKRHPANITDILNEYLRAKTVRIRIVNNI